MKKLVVLLFLMLFSHTIANAETNYNRIVFLIDASGSMNNNDPYMLSIELANMIITLAPLHVEFGFIAFDSYIVGKYGMSTYRDNIQAKIGEIVYRSWTDIGKGLRYAMELVGSYENTVVVFLTDGETISVDPNGRGHASALEDEQHALKLAQTYNIPIYAVRFGTGFGMEYLETLAVKTYGRTYRIDNPSWFADTSLQLISDIFGNNFMLHQEVVYITVNNMPPVFIGYIPNIILKNSNPKIIDLNTLFYDSDSDYINFEILEENEYVYIVDEFLVIELLNTQNLVFTIIATDEMGAYVKQYFDLRVVSFFAYHQGAFLTIAIIFLILLLIYIFLIRNIRDKSSSIIPIIYNNNHLFKDARFEGYFLNTLSGNEIPILNWGASYIENKNIVSLGEMFDMLEVDERLPEAHKIFFEAGNNNNVIFHHMTDCIVSLGKINIPKGKKEVLSFDSIMYIVFSDHSTEIELRYKRIRKRYGSRAS